MEDGPKKMSTVRVSLLLDLQFPCLAVGIELVRASFKRMLEYYLRCTAFWMKD